MTATLRAAALVLTVLMALIQPVSAVAPYQERLPGYDGYCPLIVRPGETVTFRVSVANASPATARGTATEIRLPTGLVLDEGSVRVVPGAGAGRFAPRVAASASAGMAWASTDVGDEWRSYTLVVFARVASAAVGEQLAVALSRDSTGNLIRRVDGVVYAQPGVPRPLAEAIVVDMGVPEVCAAELTPTPTPPATATPTPTPTPIPAPYYLKRLELTDIDGVGFSLAVICVIDPGQSANRAPGAAYQLVFDVPANARVALAFGPDPNIAGDGRSARFVVRPGGSAIRVAIASRPAAGEPGLRAPIVPGIRVSADGFGELAERSVGVGTSCDADAAMVPALAAAERESRAARALSNAGGAEVSVELATPILATATQPVSTQAASGRIETGGGAATPSHAAVPAADEPPNGGILPDPRAIMLPMLCGAGVALASLAFVLMVRRRGGDA